MLHGSISNSEKLAALSCDGARLLFTWLIPHCDNLGRIRAQAIYLKAVVVPKTDATLKQVEAWAAEIAGVGLVQLYTVGSDSFIQVNGWSDFQTLIGNMSRKSELPDPPEHSSNDVHTPFERGLHGVPRARAGGGGGGGEGEGEGEKEKAKAARARPRAPSAAASRKRGTGPGGFEPAIIAALEAEFPELDVGLIAEKLDNNPRAKFKDRDKALRNWCRKAQAEGWDRKGGANGAAGPPQSSERVLVNGVRSKDPLGAGIVWWDGCWRSEGEAKQYGWRP
jgi:hypothetical protein